MTRAKEKLIFTAPVAGGQKHKVHLKWVEESQGVSKKIIFTADKFGYKAKKIEKKDKDDTSL